MQGCVLQWVVPEGFLSYNHEHTVGNTDPKCELSLNSVYFKLVLLQMSLEFQLDFLFHLLSDDIRFFFDYNLPTNPALEDTKVVWACQTVATAF